MGRPPRIQVPGGFYHVHTRGNDQQAISFGNWSGRLFVREVKRAARRHGWRILAYCLMTNHYHVVFQIDDRLSAGMCELNGRFARISNWVNKRKDHLFGRRFTSHLIEDDAYLLESVRYTLLNPVRSAGVKAPEQWRWSSTRAMLGLDPAPAWLDVEFVLGYFGATPEAARRRFYAFLLEGIGRPLTVPDATEGRPLTVPGTDRKAVQLTP
jgi:REP element-mobilizing transposase RayT